MVTNIMIFLAWAIAAYSVLSARRVRRRLEAYEMGDVCLAIYLAGYDLVEVEVFSERAVAMRANAPWN